ncbi:P-loop containing nucleoside triphosphate hydrolase protein [Achaetomium macrosporum]|uniref:P-loop containing nucleoside triphosphate hydrolase protein n=1 Tax=Achaetomium macrosporum TaxID=79813 RepID=A0AAN7C1V2_9PEZI|nr:P-loop containing nucleoside triphosphate hydrolase protein [Achaetomium macrosporum]
MKSLDFRVRKLHVNTDAGKRLQKKQPSRVYVNEEALIELTGSKDGGKVVWIEKVSDSPDGPPVRREATLWQAPEKLDKSATQMYDAFRDACNYKLGDQVRITAVGGPLPDADEVVLEQLPGQDGKDGTAAVVPLEPEDIPAWEYFLAGRLSQIEHVYAGLVYKNLLLRGPERSFVVVSINGSTAGNARYLDRKTSVKIATAPVSGGQSNRVSSQKLEVTGIRGLDSQVGRLNDILGCFDSDLPFARRRPLPGIVIHGGHGTGKTMLLNSIAGTGWGTVFRIQYKDKLSEIQEAFQKARLQQPSLVLIDELQRLIDKDRNNRAAVILALCEALDALAADVAAKGENPKVVVVATCLDYTTDVPEDLKKPGRLTSEIYLPLPDVDGRREILASLGLHVPLDQEQVLLRHLSERTHAYTGDDLRRLVDEASLIGCIRHRKTPAALLDHHLPTPPPGDDAEHQESETAPPPAPLYYSPADYHEALRVVRPSAMHDINLKPPPIRWDDIGGQETVKLSLRRAVRLSLEPAELLSQYFDRPPKGFLLYGPPGCSKTMAAQAMATESGLNFFAVKGAELLNMYVGESERAVRRLFQRAREVSPSLIFFDEIDSIAGQRSGFSHNSSSSSSNGGHGGIHVLTTLLNEMDGFEALAGVIVVGATNRPQAVDPALLRPGRFDELIYVGPPDEAARRTMFAQFAASRRVHADVDVDRLARDTDGYSGAEIRAICRAAGTAAFDRFCEGGEPAITMEDLGDAIRHQRKQITKEMLQGYEDWERQFRKY